MQLASAASQATVPRLWWASIRADLRSLVNEAALVGAGVVPEQKRWLRQRADTARLLLAHMNELELDVTPEAAFCQPETEASRHPRVVWANAISSERKSCCFATVEQAWEAAVTEHPFNNTRLHVSWCDENQDAEEKEAADDCG